MSIGMDWKQSNITNGSFRDVYYNGYKYVALGYPNETNGLYTSTNGTKDWVRNDTATGMYNHACYDGEKWVACSTDGLWYSDLGDVWSKTSGTSGEYEYVFHANNLWVAGSLEKGLWYSTNGKNWTQSAQKTGWFECIYYANNLWVAGGYHTGLFYSTDGNNWTKSSSFGDDFNGVKHIIFNGTIWVITANDDGIWYSNDGKNWSQSSIYNEALSLCYANNIWVSDGNEFVYSTDGITWTAVTSPIAGVTGSQGIYYYEGLWISCAKTEGILISSDGKAWNKTNKTNGYMFKACYGQNLWVAVDADNGGIWYSENEGPGPEPTMTGIKVAQMPTKVDYNIGDEFDSTGLVINKVFSDGTEKATTSYTLSGFDSATAGTKTITVTYTE